MVGFSELQVRGYRHLHDVKIPLGPLNVLIGANGAGKSSVLEVMHLLAASARGRLEETISAAGGFQSLLTRGRAEPMEFVISHNDGEGEELNFSSRYEITLRTIGHGGYRILREHLSEDAADDPLAINDATGDNIRFYDYKQKNFVETDWERQPSETSLSQVNKFFRDHSFRQKLASSALYHVLDVSSRAPVRLPQPLRPADLPGSDGGNLISCLYALRESAPERYAALEDGLRLAFPLFERLGFPAVAAGLLMLTWKESPYVEPLYSNQLSEGALRYLWLATLLQSPGLPTVTLIDEPEVSLHPEMLRLLVELMREASARTQLIVATHSEALIRFLRPEEILVCDRQGPADGGGATVTSGSALDLDRWLADYRLDELWAMGELGGRRA
jgi:predicted ATPase